MRLEVITAHPIATASSFAFYLAVAFMLTRYGRRILLPLFAPSVSPGRRYSPGLEAFRGIAATVVALAHCAYFTHPALDLGALNLGLLNTGNKTVPMFASLSGFLIYRSVLAIRSLDDFRYYLMQRLFRIYPLYLATELVLLLAGQFIAPDGRFGGVPFAVSDLLMFRVLGFPFFANPVAWSLYVEVLFYMVLPVVFFATGPSRMLLVSVLMLMALGIADQVPNREFQLWKFFVVGIIASDLALRFPRWKRQSLAQLTFLCGLALLLIDLCGSRFDWAVHLGARHNTLGFTIGMAAALFCIFVALSQINWANAIANVAPFRVLGTVSYSIFLVHPLFILANFPNLLLVNVGRQTAEFEALEAMPPWYVVVLFLPGILAWSMLTYLMIERPFVRWARGMRTGPQATASAIPEPSRSG